MIIYYILANCYKEKNFYEYLKELWIYYPYIEDLKNLKDEQKIMSKLSSTLPNYSSWLNNIQKDIIKAIKNTNLLSSDQIKKKIKDECVEIDKILKKLAKIIENFSSKDDNKDEEYFSKNDNLLVKDINTIYNSIFKNSKDKKKQLTKKDKENIIKSMNQEKKDFGNISTYLESNTCLIFDSVFFLALKQIGLQEELIPKPNSEIRNMFLEDDNWYNDDDCDFFEFFNREDKPKKNDEQKNDDKELKEWIKVATNFVFCFHKGFQMFQTINLSKKIVNKNKKIYRKSLDDISEEYDDYQNSKRLYEKDPIKNLLIIKESIAKIKEIRGKLLILIKKLKKEIDENINKKRGIIGNIIYQIIKLGENLFILTFTKDAIKFMNILNIGLEITNIVFSGIDMSYTNDIIDELIKILKEAKEKKKEVESEIKSLNQNFIDIKKGYPTYYK